MTFCLKYIIALAAVAFVSACSIKEDRSDCPCILTVTLYETTEEYTAKYRVKGQSKFEGQ